MLTLVCNSIFCQISAYNSCCLSVPNLIVLVDCESFLLFLSLILDSGFLTGPENASDGRYPTGPRICGASGVEASQLKKKHIPASRSTPPDSSYATTARKRGLLKSNDKKTDSSMFRRPDHKKPSDNEVEIAANNASGAFHDGYKEGDENVPERINEKTRFSKQETRRALFQKSSDSKVHKFGGSRAGSRVAPYHEESSESTVVVSNVTDNIHKNHRECEDLSLIRSQLIQIEKQQSNLFDLLQVCFHYLKIEPLKVI